MITRERWEGNKARLLAAIEQEIIETEADLRLLEASLPEDGDPPATTIAKMDACEAHLEEMRRSLESIENETYEEALASHAYDTWKAKREDGELKCH